MNEPAPIDPSRSRGPRAPGVLITRPPQPLTSGRSALGLARSALRRLPFTFAMAVAVLAATAAADALTSPISPQVLSRWGFGLPSLHQGRILTLFTSAFLVYRPYMVLTISAMLLFFVGASEYLLRTRRTVVIFWLGQLAADVGAIGVLVLLDRLGTAWAHPLLARNDVGASNGAFAAAGAALVQLPSRVRRTAFGLFVAYLLVAWALEHMTWDVEHPIAFLVGIGAGVLLQVRRTGTWPDLLPRFQLERRSRPAVLAWTTASAGVMNVLGAFILPHHPGFARLLEIDPFASPDLPRHLLLVTGGALLVLAPGLTKRQRMAWSGTVVALVVSLGVQIHARGGQLEAVLTAFLLATAVAWSEEFPAPSDRPSVRQGIRALLGAAFLLPVYSLAGFYILRMHFRTPVTWGSALLGGLGAAVFQAPARIVSGDREARWFVGSIPLVAWSAVFFALVRILRGVVAHSASTADLESARRLVGDHGRTGTSYMTLWGGMSYHFATERRAMIAFRTEAGTAVALGDPIGPPEAWDDAIRSFLRLCETHGWEPAFYAASSRLLPACHAAGLQALKIGEEAIVPLEHLEFRGKEWQDVRTAINKAAKLGVTFRMFEGGSIPDELMEQMRALDRAWITKKALPPMGFTLGRLDDLADPNVNVAVVLGPDGSVQAFADWLPVYAAHGWVVDVMRRGEGAMSGVMDYLIGMSFLTFQERGYAMASLAVAPLADTGRGTSPSFAQKALGTLYERFENWYDFKSLFHFKEKFQPSWEPVHLVYRSNARIPAITWAVLKAHIPDLDLMLVARLLGSAVVEGLSSAAQRPEA